MRRVPVLGAALAILLATACTDDAGESVCSGEDLVALQVATESPPELGDIGGYRQIALLDPESGTAELVTPTSMNAEDPSFSPDGKRLVFANGVGDYESAGPGDYTLWVLDVESGETRRITGGPDWTQQGGHAGVLGLNDADPDWSPVDDEIVFVHAGPDIGLDPNVGHQALFIVEPGGEPRALLPTTPTGTQDYAPAWSPDGRQIAFIRRVVTDIKAPSTAQLWLVDAEGQNPHPVVEVGNEEVVWWPGQDKIILTGDVNQALVGIAGDQPWLREVDVATGEVNLVSPPVNWLAVTRDGKRFYSQETELAHYRRVLKVTTNLDGDPTSKPVNIRNLESLGIPGGHLDVTACTT
jgi:Tol biopolymer transport system component